MNIKEIVTNLLIIVVGALVVYSLMLTTTIGVDIKSYYNRVDSLQIKIDSAMAVNQRIDNKIAKLDSSILVINNEISLVDENINIIKTRTNAKVSAVDNFNYSELQKFFSKRYNPNNPK
jgi:peptidoglycan hydrolase CwlO-like protein